MGCLGLYLGNPSISERSCLPAHFPQLGLEGLPTAHCPTCSPAHKPPPPETLSYGAKRWKNSLNLDDFFCTSFEVSCTANLWAVCWAGSLWFNGHGQPLAPSWVRAGRKAEASVVSSSNGFPACRRRGPRPPALSILGSSCWNVALQKPGLGGASDTGQPLGEGPPSYPHPSF